MIRKIFGWIDRVGEEAMEESIAVKWEDQHDEILGYARDVIKNFTSNNRMGVKRALKKLNVTITDHFTSEDMELYNLLRQNILGDVIREEIEGFRNDLKTKKVQVMNFLTKSSQAESVLDEVFFEKFADMNEELMARFKKEELSLYAIMKQECICRVDLIYAKE